MTELTRPRVPFTANDDTLVMAHAGQPGGIAYLVRLTGRDRRVLTSRYHRLLMDRHSPPTRETERDHTLMVYELLDVARGKTAEELTVKTGYALSTVTADLRHLVRGNLAKQDGDLWYRQVPKQYRPSVPPRMPVGFNQRGRHVSRRGKGTA